VLSLFPALAPAQTGGSSVPVVGGSWYFAGQVGGVSPPAGTPIPPVAPPAGVPTPDVPDGDFPVAVFAGQSNKESYLQLDSSAIPAGSSVSSLVLTLQEDPAGQNLNAATATIAARAVTGFLASGDKAKPYANKPGYDTNGPAALGTRTPDGKWTFELKDIATRWASGELSNNGIALVPNAPVETQNYEVVWFGPGKDKGPTTIGAITLPAPSPASPDPSSASAPAEDTSGQTVSIAPDTSGALASDVPVQDFSAPGASATPAPQPAAGATNNAASAAVRRIGTTHPAPPWSFYLAIIAAIALVGLSTVSLGELGEPEPDRQGGVLRTLERRTQQGEAT
jgi:hypothetical protein